MTSNLTEDRERVESLDVGTLLEPGKHLIGGSWVGSKSGESIDVINPANQALIARVPRGAAEDIDDAVRSAAAAFKQWRGLSPTKRGELLSRWATLCREWEQQIDLLERLEVGRPPRGGSAIPSHITFAAYAADKITGQSLPTSTSDVLGMTLREPYGVCGAIIPWNGPGPVMVINVAPALAAGNTVVVKPAEDSPLTCLLLGKLALEAGIPPGVLNVVTGYGPEAGAALPLHPLVRHMSFTGSPETGALVMEACARNLIPLHLELGGKSPQVVFSDAPLEKALPTILRGITLNTGQVCVAGSRLVVEEQVHDEVVSRLAEAFREVKVGLWYEQVDMGPLINAKQEQRVLGYIASGNEEGAQLVTGGGKVAGEKFARGFFVEPTLFDAVQPSMRIAQEEIFGPVLAVLSFRDEGEALEIANGTPYGLVASVWTRDVGKAIRMARGIEAGQVAINAHLSPGVIGAPMGGYKRSGFGRQRSMEAIAQEYTQVKSVVMHPAD